MSLTVILIFAYFLINAFLTGQYTVSEMPYKKSTINKILWFSVYALFGAIFYVVVTPLWLFQIIWVDYLKSEALFYYRFYFTKYFEKVIAERKAEGIDMIQEWNKIARHHKGYTHRKLKRHVALLNKRFNYSPTNP